MFAKAVALTMPEAATDPAQAAADALAAPQQQADMRALRQAYADALRHWPDHLALLLGFGNAACALGERVAAAAAFRHASEAHPHSATAFNNLAMVLAELGEFDTAHQAARRAVALGGAGRDAASAGLREIEAMQRSQGVPCDPPTGKALQPGAPCLRRLVNWLRRTHSAR
jgi:Tfp pilus assembly protein PilF